jgi:hypothetical protein
VKIIIAALAVASLLIIPNGVMGRPDTWVVLAKADFDSDGREDNVLGKTTKVVGAYHTIRVQAASGEPLLQLSSGQFFQSVRVAAEGFPRPILVTTQSAGNRFDVRAFMYVPRSGELQPIRWDDQEVATTSNVEVRRGELVLYTWEGNPVVYRLEGEQLVRRK